MQTPWNKVTIIFLRKTIIRLWALGLGLQRLKITGGNGVGGHIQHSERQPLRGLHQHLPSANRYQHCPRPHNPLSPAESLNPTSVMGTRQPPPTGTSIKNPVDGRGSRDLVEWVP